MTDALLVFVTGYGLPAIAAATFLSCLALPVPSSLVMLAAGGFVSSGDLEPAGVLVSAFSGAVAGDAAGYAAGRLAFGERASRLEGLRHAADTLDRHGAAAVFLSRWLFSPLGPYVNFAAGAARFPPARFAVADAAGEAVWVGLYVGLGAAFTRSIPALSDILGSLTGLLAALAVAAGALWWIRQAQRRSA